jgi:hypothetical protein
MALAAFAPTAYSSFAALSTSTNVALPGGGGATLLVTNLGPNPVVIALGNAALILAGSGNGIALNPGQSIALTVGANTNIAAMALGFGNAQLNMAQGA